MILTIVSLFLLYTMHSPKSKASDVFKTYGILDIITTFILMFFIYMIGIIFVIPGALENLKEILTFKHGTEEFAVVVGLTAAGVLAIIHVIRHIKRIKEAGLPIIKTLFIHCILSFTFFVVIPAYYIFGDPDGTIEAGGEAVLDKRIAEKERMTTGFNSAYTDSVGNTTYYNNKGYKTGTSYTDSLGKTQFYDNDGNKTGESYTDTLGKTTYYDKDGKITKTSYTDILGKTHFYDKDGKKTGEAYTDSVGNTNFYDE